MRILIAVAVVAVLGGCGLDTATSAATAASLKKQELEQGQRTMKQAQEKIGAAMQLEQERANIEDK